MQLIDIGVNLLSPSFDTDREAALLRAEAAGVSPLIITGSSVESSAEAAAFARQYNAPHPGKRSSPAKLYSTVGVHPHNARFWDETAEKAIKELVGNAAGSGKPNSVSQAVLAIGECGLDYNRDFSPRDAQRRCFEDQIHLASDLEMPLFLHARDAFEDFSAILENGRGKVPDVVVHCFTGTERELEKYLDLGCYIGITGWICDERRGKHLIPLLKNIPANRLLLETDAPYLTPRNMPNAKKIHRNESANLVHIAAFIAEALEKDIETLAKETFENTIRFFGIEYEEITAEYTEKKTPRTQRI
ncbi:MAG: TatD family hydrolase [Treponema sp.]|jgi:TatD DNase family protein|nr:TatD family hydrolase [Treponema sp.]